MTQIWTNNNKGDKIIAFANATLYKANPKEEEVAFLVARMQMNDFSDPALFALPIDYIKEVCLQEGNDYIQVFFSKDSEEHFIIKDPALREEIFNYLKAHMPGSSYKLDQYDKMRAARKPVIGLGVVLLLFFYTLYVMSALNNGAEVMMFGRIGGLIVGLISLGTVNVLLIYAALIGIAGYNAFRKMRNPPVVHVISMGRAVRI
jgi:hypothetical protein